MGRPPRLPKAELVRYGIIGVVNTLFGYGLFVAMQLSLGAIVHYSIIQAISNVIAMVEAYWLQRWLVFRHKGNWWLGLVKFASVYSGAFVFSLAFVALLHQVFGVDVLVAGAITIIIQTIGTYAANKWFTFRPGGTAKGGAGSPADDQTSAQRTAQLWVGEVLT